MPYVNVPNDLSKIKTKIDAVRARETWLQLVYW